MKYLLIIFIAFAQQSMADVTSNHDKKTDRIISIGSDIRLPFDLNTFKGKNKEEKQKSSFSTENDSWILHSGIYHGRTSPIKNGIFHFFLLPEHRKISSLRDP